MPIDLWVVQGNLGSTGDTKTISETCRKLGCECRIVNVIPFSRELPEIETDRKVVFYGSSNFTTNVYRSGKWNPGVFFDEESFSYSSSIERFGKMMLNSDGKIGSMIELSQLPFDTSETLFFRPNRDLKEFAGMVQTFGEFKSWVNTLSVGEFEIDVNSKALLATTKKLAHEWRIFIVNGKVVSGSHYRSFGEMSVSPSVPVEVIEFCESATKIWVPAPVFVMDVAEADNKLFIIEFNGFNSSGFYDSDIEKIVEAVTNYDTVSL